MSAFELILHGMADVVTNPLTLLYLLAGTFGGIIFGAIPGLTGALGVSLMLPFTFSMPPTQGIAMLIGIYVGGVSGGLIASIMLNIPGNAAAIVTCFDGAPMARNGQPDRRHFQRYCYDSGGDKAGAIWLDVWFLGVFCIRNHGPGRSGVSLQRGYDQGLDQRNSGHDSGNGGAG